LVVYIDNNLLNKEYWSDEDADNNRLTKKADDDEMDIILSLYKS
jgi:hypothetical protein